jgi:hypothetical protein
MSSRPAPTSHPPLSTAKALALFDSLPAVSQAEVLGAWRGEGLHTAHPLDGLLEACRWHGKRVDDAENVHPLMFDTLAGGTVAIRPLGVWLVRLGLACVMRLPVLKSPAVGRVVQALLPLLRTRRSQARLRMIECRGKASATIVYDSLPVQDALRRLDADTLLGMMDSKGVRQPFFFVLRREPT